MHPMAQAADRAEKIEPRVRGEATHGTFFIHDAALVSV